MRLLELYLFKKNCSIPTLLFIMQNFIIAKLLFVSAISTIVDALNCTCGSYCPNATLPYLHSVPCPVGYYCPEGHNVQQTFPVVCPAGYLCPKAGLCAPEPTPCGYYSPKGSSAPAPCKAGTYCPANSTLPVECNPPSLCPHNKTCAVVSSHKVMSSKTRTTTPIQLDITLKPRTTTPSHFSTAAQHSKTTTAAVCPSPQCSPMQPPGYICPNDPLLGCKPICIEPTICGNSETSIKKGITTSGTDHKLITSTTPGLYKCGYYVPENLPISPLYEQPCRSGYFCHVGKSGTHPSKPKKCPAGHYCGSGACLPSPCPCGHKCPEGSSAPIASQPPYSISKERATQQKLCPIGHKCDRPAMCAATPCPNGTYVTCKGKKACDPCPKGRYCPTVTKSVLCPAGFYCGGGVAAPVPCPANFFCPLGSSAATACPKGKKAASGSKSSHECK